VSYPSALTTATNTKDKRAMTDVYSFMMMMLVYNAIYGIVVCINGLNDQPQPRSATCYDCFKPLCRSIFFRRLLVNNNNNGKDLVF
jgi:hypothetical protein